jgi:hypothetical protein
MCCGIGLASAAGMRFGRVTRYALLLVPLLVCAARLHAQRAAPPNAVVQEANRCLSLVRASSRRRQRNEREQRAERVESSVRTDTIAIHREYRAEVHDVRAS